MEERPGNDDRRVRKASGTARRFFVDGDAAYLAGQVQLGAYQVSKHNLDEDPIELGSLTKASGVLVPVELAWAPRFGGGSLLGSYKAGGWYDSTRADDILTAAGAVNGRRAGRHGGYVSIVQEILRDRRAVPAEARSLSAFFHATKADQRTAIIDLQFAAGLLLKRPLASRPSDLVGLAVATSRSNPRLASFRRLTAPSSAQYSERVFELFYRAQVYPYLAIQPGVQYVSTPGGLRHQSDVIAPTLRLATTF